MSEKQLLHVLRLLFDPGANLHKIHWDATARSQQVMVEYFDGGRNYHKVGINIDGTFTTYE